MAKWFPNQLVLTYYKQCMWSAIDFECFYNHISYLWSLVLDFYQSYQLGQKSILIENPFEMVNLQQLCVTFMCDCLSGNLICKAIMNLLGWPVLPLFVCPSQYVFPLSQYVVNMSPTCTLCTHDIFNNKKPIDTCIIDAFDKSFGDMICSSDIWNISTLSFLHVKGRFLAFVQQFPELTCVAQLGSRG